MKKEEKEVLSLWGRDQGRQTREPQTLAEEGSVETVSPQAPGECEGRVMTEEV